MFDYTELNKLEQMCRDAGWNIEVQECWDGKQIVLRDNGQEYVNDAVINSMSYGHEKGYLETWHKVEDEEEGWDDDVEGYLTANKVFSYWAEDLKESNHYD